MADKTFISDFHQGGKHGKNTTAGDQASPQAPQREPQRAQARCDEEMTKERDFFSLFLFLLCTFANPKRQRRALQSASESPSLTLRVRCGGKFIRRILLASL
jgi:hypothetical protein